MIPVLTRVYNGVLINAHQGAYYYLSDGVYDNAYFALLINNELTSNAKWFTVYRIEELTRFKKKRMIHP